MSDDMKVGRTIVIQECDGLYIVREDDRRSGELCWDEMVGQIARITIGGREQEGMFTEAERAEYQRRMGIALRITPERDFVELPSGRAALMHPGHPDHTP